MTDSRRAQAKLEEVIPRDVLRAEVRAWCRRMGVKPKEVHIRPMTRKWGSCSTSGRVTFSAHILSEPASFRRRVIVEELLHLKVPNHGKLFKSLLKAYLGSAEEVVPPPGQQRSASDRRLTRTYAGAESRR